TGQTRRHLVDDLLALVIKRGRQPGEQRLDLVGGKPGGLTGALMRIGRVGRVPLAVDDDDGDLALALAERIAAGVEMPAERSDRLRQLWVLDPDFARPAQRA